MNPPVVTLLKTAPPASRVSAGPCGDLTDGVSLVNLVHEIEPHEVYNLGAQSHVKVSFEMPE